MDKRVTKQIIIDSYNKENHYKYFLSNDIILINDEPINFDSKDGLNLYQICQLEDLILPRFCYHEKLTVAGNCRICLVELDDITKPILACATIASDDLTIFTDTKLVKDAQEGVIEYLLVNHPLDCPICDQGGECDLQDQTIIFGTDRGRFYESFKRSVEDSNYGPLIKTVLNRCIHCSRCIRFLDEIAGMNILVFINRGENMQISSYIKKFIESEISGNIIDLCPVGALTSKPYSFVSRLWEISSVKHIDVMDAVHSNISIHTRGMNILRIVPRVNDFINEDWISDKIRFFYDSLDLQRIQYPIFIYNSKKIRFGWLNTLYFIKLYFFNVINFYYKKKKKFLLKEIFIGDFLSVEELILIKNFTNNCSFPLLKYVYQTTKKNNDLRYKFLFNTHFFELIQNEEEVIKLNNLYFIIASNPRYEAPILNLKLKRLNIGRFVVLIGYLSNINYNYIHFGNNVLKLISLLEFSNNIFLYIKNFFNYFWIFGSTYYFNTNYSESITHYILNKISPNMKLLNIIHANCSDINLQELNVANDVVVDNLNINSLCNFYYFVNANNIFNKFFCNNNLSLIIYQGAQSDYTSKFANLILPTKLYFEKPSIFINTEGLVQNLKNHFFRYSALKSIKFDSQIFTILYELFQIDLALVDDERSEDEILKDYLIISDSWSTFFHISKLNEFFSYFVSDILLENRFFNKLFGSFINNFYLTNSLARNSKILSICSKHYTVYNDFKYIITIIFSDND